MIDTTGLILTEYGRWRIAEGPLKGKTAFRCPACFRGLTEDRRDGRSVFICAEQGIIQPEDILDLRKVTTDEKTTRIAREIYDGFLEEAEEQGFSTVRAYYDSLPERKDSYKEYLRLGVGLEEIFGMKPKAAPKEVPEVQREINAVKAAYGDKVKDNEHLATLVHEVFGRDRAEVLRCIST